MSRVRLTQYDGYIFFVRTAMTPAQIATVRSSFDMVSPQSGEACRIFYEELFNLAPDLKALFPDNMTRQKQKFIQMLSIVVNNLDNISRISEYIEDLGRRHVGYEVEDEYYDIVEEAFLSMLERLLGDDMRPEVRDAWASAYDMIARMMKEASSGPYTAEGFFGSIIRGVITSQYGMSIAQRKNVAANSPITHVLQRGKVVQLS